MTDSLPQVRLHNTLTRRTAPLQPLEAGKVSIYTCGSTVYKYAHIGNLRTYLFGDLLHRTLAYLGYEVRYVEHHGCRAHARRNRSTTLGQRSLRPVTLSCQSSMRRMCSTMLRHG